VPRSEPEGRPEGGPRVLRVAVEGAPLHLGHALDYLAPEGVEARVGHRVELSLAGRRTRGLVVATDVDTEVETARLRPIGRLLGDAPWTDQDGVDLLVWAAERFGAPLGDVVRHAFPGRVVDEERRAVEAGHWPPSGEAERPGLAGGGHGPDGTAWSPYGPAGSALQAAVGAGSGSFVWRPAPGEDVAARVVELTVLCLAAGRDVLMVVPDPRSRVADAVVSTVRALVTRPAEAVVDLRGGPSPRMLYRGWLLARSGRARVVIGERSSAFVPLTRLGLAIVLDEASPVHKEQRSPRHHVREVLLERARRGGGVGLVTADVPSVVARSLVAGGRLTEVVADPEVVAARRPVVLLETGGAEARARISTAGMRALRGAVERGGYGVVLAALRGEGRALVCTRCHDLVRCPSCGAAVARSASGGRWCPTCGSVSDRPPRCERCGPTELAPLAAGAERLGAELARSLEAPVVVLEGHAPDVPPAPAVLVMTRGSVLDQPPAGADVLAVVLPDLDGALRRPALEAAEDALRLAFRVAGWTVASRAGAGGAGGAGAGGAGGAGAVGPEGRPGPGGARPASGTHGPHVVVETRDPDHHAFRALVDWDADAFWTAEEELRRPLRLPPHAPAIRLEFERSFEDALGRVRDHLAAGDVVVGPLPIARGRRALLIRSQDRASTLAALWPLRAALSRQGTELRVDVDPVDLG